MRVVSIGDLVTDFYYKDNKLVGICGGMSSHNIIANISKMKLDTAVYGVCGNDLVGEIAIKSLKDLGVNTEHIKIIEKINTRCFHVSYFSNDSKLKFKSKKRCPFCNEKKWYEESLINPKCILNNILKDDILVFDNLNLKNQEIIDHCQNKKMLDLGQYFELENYSNQEIKNKISNKFTIINLNERVEKYLKERFNLNSLEEIYNLLKPTLIIVTRGKKGSSFVYENTLINLNLDYPAIELDPTGAGDAFFAVFISEYIKNNFIIDSNFINNTFRKATKLTSKVVKTFGARGHLNNLYKIKKVDEKCTCQDFTIIVRKKIKRCNININNLETRVINALNSKAYQKLKQLEFKDYNNSLFIGTGGSFAGAKFAAKIINNLYGTNSFALLPRDVYYHNNSKVDKVFLFTYSGTTNDLFVATSKISDEKKYIITKGEKEKIALKTDITKENILTYRSTNNKSNERGFLSFEGAVAPASLFLKLYFDMKQKDNVEEFIVNSFSYWNNYFETYFKENKEELKTLLQHGNTFNIFTGDFTEIASIDLESKIIESGIFNCLIHEKKNFSHGRFINYEHLSKKLNIYFKQKTTSNYENKLLDYLSKDQTLIIESCYDGILCEFDLLVASQYLMYAIANFLDIDISKPTYSEEALKIYYYKGDL